jgi:rhodanese-related sulfurtransferase
VIRIKVIGILLATVAGAGLLLVRQPSIEAELAAIEPALNAKLSEREVQIDPGELVDLIYNFNTGLRIIDVRDEAEFNLFHIIDAQHATLDQMRDPAWVKRLPEETVFVLVSNDEKRATQAWKLLSAQGILNLYILAGGINYWLEIYDTDSQARTGLGRPKPDPKGDDTLRHEFAAALGSRHPAADPDPKEFPRREYVKKVKPIGRAPKKSGGCG